MISRPMLADSIRIEGDFSEERIRESLSLNLSFPAMLTPKLDGIRCLKVNGKAVTRNFKPFPNVYVRELVEQYIPNGADGELMVPGDCFQTTSSELMTHSGQPTFEYCMFDLVQNGLDQPYAERVAELAALTMPTNRFPVRLILPTIARNVDDFLRYEEACLKQGYEGVIIRSPFGPYKCGRSTVKQGWMIKWKRMEDSEAKIEGFVEALANLNEATTNELGLTKRSHCQSGRVAKGTLGALAVKDVNPRSSCFGQIFEIGTGKGLTADLRQKIWDAPDKYLGTVVKYRFQPTGVKEKPRFPSFQGFRSVADLG